MRLLLDTHIALWFLLGDERLSHPARALVSDGSNIVFVSAVNIWEIAIKHKLRRGSADDMPLSGEEAIGRFADLNLDMLPVSATHAAAVENLPPLHADPFDRLLLAQATTEPLRLLTSDRKILAYGGPVLAA
jgi:PIN domain nuclease of toxin-antitoxin system